MTISIAISDWKMGSCFENVFILLMGRIKKIKHSNTHISHELQYSDAFVYLAPVLLIPLEIHYKLVLSPLYEDHFQHALSCTHYSVTAAGAAVNDILHYIYYTTNCVWQKPRDFRTDHVGATLWIGINVAVLKKAKEKGRYIQVLFSNRLS